MGGLPGRPGEWYRLKKAQVEKLITSMTESTTAYCQIIDCENLLIYR